MTDEVDVGGVPAGRPVRLVPTPPGLWMTLLGVGVAALAPLFGFLSGSVWGKTGDGTAMSPIFWGLFIGVLIGAVGVLSACVGGVRWWRFEHRADVPEKDPVA